MYSVLQHDSFEQSQQFLNYTLYGYSFIQQDPIPSHGCNINPN
jgi:hypothetical protein